MNKEILDYKYSRKQIRTCPSCKEKTLSRTDDGWRCHNFINAIRHLDYGGWECGFTMEMIE